MEAVKEKRKREAALFKEKNEMLDDRDVRKYIRQTQKVVNRIKEKLAVKNRDIGNNNKKKKTLWFVLKSSFTSSTFVAQEKKEMSVILENMNDLNVSFNAFIQSIPITYFFQLIRSPCLQFMKILKS